MNIKRILIFMTTIGSCYAGPFNNLFNTVKSGMYALRGAVPAARFMQSQTRNFSMPQKVYTAMPTMFPFHIPATFVGLLQTKQFNFKQNKKSAWSPVLLGMMTFGGALATATCEEQKDSEASLTTDDYISQIKYTTLVLNGIRVKNGYDYQQLALYAVRSNNPDLLRAIFVEKKDVNVNAIDEDGKTLLHKALCSDKSEALVKVLLVHPDLDVNQRNDLGMTPFASGLSEFISKEGLFHFVDSDRVQASKKSLLSALTLLALHPKLDINAPLVLREDKE